MKKIVFAASLWIIFGCCRGLHAQQASPVITTQDSLKKDSLNKLLNTRAKSIYLEAGGPGSFYSLNYDTRFKKKQNGLGARIGITYILVDNENSIAIPFALNYLFGKQKHYFELGAGATYFYDFKTDYSLLFNEEPPYISAKLSKFGSGVIGTFSAGYRYQPLKGGFTFRAGNSIIFKKDFLPLWPYVSVGYTFKNKVKPTKVKSS